MASKIALKRWLLGAGLVLCLLADSGCATIAVAEIGDYQTSATLPGTVWAGPDGSIIANIAVCTGETMRTEHDVWAQWSVDNQRQCIERSQAQPAGSDQVITEVDLNYAGGADNSGLPVPTYRNGAGAPGCAATPPVGGSIALQNLDQPGAFRVNHVVDGKPYRFHFHNLSGEKKYWWRHLARAPLFIPALAFDAVTSPFQVQYWIAGK